MHASAHGGSGRSTDRSPRFVWASGPITVPGRALPTDGSHDGPRWFPDSPTLPCVRVTKEARAAVEQQPRIGYLVPARPPGSSASPTLGACPRREWHAGPSPSGDGHGPATPARRETTRLTQFRFRTGVLPRPDSPSGIRIKGSTPSSPSRTRERRALAAAQPAAECFGTPRSGSPRG